MAATALTIKASGLAKLATSMATAPLLGASSSLPLPPVGSLADSSLVDVASEDEELVLLSVGRAMVVFLDMAVPVAAVPLAPTPVPTPPAGTVVVASLSLTVVVVLLTMTDWTTPPVAVALEEDEEDDEAVAGAVELPDEEELETAVLPVSVNGPE